MSAMPAPDVHSDDVVLTAEDLVAGADATFEVELPANVFPAATAVDRRTGRVRLRPLTVRDVHLIAKAAKADDVLTVALMIQKAVVEPALTDKDVARMPAGLVRFLVEQIDRISGLRSSDDELRGLAGSPIVQAFFVLTKEFGWTPDEIRRLTVAQVLAYLEMLTESRRLGTA